MIQMDPVTVVTGLMLGAQVRNINPPIGVARARSPLTDGNQLAAYRIPLDQNRCLGQLGQFCYLAGSGVVALRSFVTYCLTLQIGPVLLQPTTTLGKCNRRQKPIILPPIFHARNLLHLQLESGPGLGVESTWLEI